MTATQQIKQAVIDYLTACEIDPDLQIVDAKQREVFDLPIVAVDIIATEAHSSALSMVHRAEVSIMLRSHPGDEAEAAIQSWSDRIESALYDNSAITAIFSDAGIMVYEWIYAGNTQIWDESVLGVEFTASTLVQRMT
jgi:hypothetical protein